MPFFWRFDQNLSFKERILLNTSSSVDPIILRFLRIFLSKGLKKGLVFFSNPSVEGTVKRFLFRANLTYSLLFMRSGFSGLIVSAKDALLAVYS